MNGPKSERSFEPEEYSSPKILESKFSKNFQFLSFGPFTFADRPFLDHPFSIIPQLKHFTRDRPFLVWPGKIELNPASFVFCYRLIIGRGTLSERVHRDSPIIHNGHIVD